MASSAVKAWVLRRLRPLWASICLGDPECSFDSATSIVVRNLVLRPSVIEALLGQLPLPLRLDVVRVSHVAIAVDWSHWWAMPVSITLG